MNKVIIGADVQGNIGSCQINSEIFSVSSFYSRTVAVNSCTGEIISDSGVYYQWAYVFVPFAIFVVIAGIFLSLKKIVG